MDPIDNRPGVVVTGASQGIGKAIVLSLLQNGYAVLGLSRSKPEGLPATSSNSLVWNRLDLSDTREVAAFAATVGQTPIRALILSAVDYGANGRHSAAVTTAEEWHRVIGTNCIGQCILVSELLPNLLESSPGIVINISSNVALSPSAGRAAYAASKAGLHAMLRAVAAENPDDQLRVYQLVPTFQFLTEGIRKRRPPGFDFSSYGDPALIGQIVRDIVEDGGQSMTPGAYLVQRDGRLAPLDEIREI